MKSYVNCGDTPITMDMGCFKIQYRNHLGGNRLGIFKTGTAEEARQEFNAIHGGEVDETPLRIERISTFGEHTHTWTCDNNWDSCLRLQWVVGP